MAQLSKSQLAAFVVAALAAAWLGWRFFGEKAAAPVSELGASTGYVPTGTVQESSPSTAESPALPAAESTQSVTSYYDRFRSANDLAPFAEAMHAQALQGDDAAQYWLSRVLQRCGVKYDFTFNIDHAQSDAPPLSLDDALAAEEARPHFGADEIREMHGQCQRFRAMERSRFGSARIWLRQAAESGYPAAQIGRAMELATEGTNPEEARRLMLAAVKSGDAEVIRETGEVAQSLARNESERERLAWVWEVAACQRGANCGPTTEWLRSLCAADGKCQPYDTAIDFIRRRVGAQMPEIEEEARKLNGHIDAREWGELGL